MRNAPLTNVTVLLYIFCATGLYSQEPRPAKTATTPVPRLVRWSSSFRPTNGQPIAPIESVTLSIYQDEKDSTPLWSEIQNVTVDADGHYALLIGSTIPGGVPADLFSTGEPRWLGTQFNRPGEAQQPRILLASVPYALKAADAETLGGLPASAYLLAPSIAAADSITAVGDGPSPSGEAPRPANFVKPLKAAPAVSAGSTNFLGVFTNSTDLGNSLLFQKSGKIGLSTTTPLDYFHVAFNDASGGFTGYAVQNLGNGAGSYSGMLFYDQTGKLAQFQGFNNSSHEYRINNIASNASINFMVGNSSKLLLANNGNVGIGTPTPGAKLEVAGNLLVDGNINLSGTILSGSNGSPLIQDNGSSFGAGYGALMSNTSGFGNAAVGDNAMQSNMDGRFNTALGQNALLSNKSGSLNTAIGASALAGNTASFNTAVGGNALLNNSTGGFNTAVGAQALDQNISGQNNTAVGAQALLQSTGGDNTAVGAQALQNNTSFANTAVGSQTLSLNTSGNGNTALGASALGSNVTGTNNTALGAGALAYSTSISNTAVGSGALSNQNNTAGYNTAVGWNALSSVTSGASNTAVGQYAGSTMTVGSANTAIGGLALLSNQTGNSNTAIGGTALNQLTSGNNNVAIGQSAGGSLHTGSNNIYISSDTYSGEANESGVTRIGDLANGTATSTFIAGIYGFQTGNMNDSAVMISANGRLGTIHSSRRYKEDIQDMADASSRLMKLRPVTFRYRTAFDDGSKPLQYGLIAEEVDEVYPDLVARSGDGQIETVKYQVLPSMLLNELQKQNAQITSLTEQVAARDEQIGGQARQIRSLEERLLRLEVMLAKSFQ